MTALVIIVAGIAFVLVMGVLVVGSLLREDDDA